MRKHNDVIVRLIGAGKLAKGILLIAVAFGAFALLNPGNDAQAHAWIDHGNEHVRSLFAKMDSSRFKLIEVGAGSLLYAAMFLVEGYALLRRRVWGEYLTIVITMSFIPFEVYEIVHENSATTWIVLIANIAIVVYLIGRRWHVSRESRGVVCERDRLIEVG